MKNLKTNEQEVRAKAKQDREAIRIVSKRVNQSPATARAFLVRAGIATPGGKLRKPYR